MDENFVGVQYKFIHAQKKIIPCLFLAKVTALINQNIF